MKSKKAQKQGEEFEFALIVGGVPALTQKVEDALFKAGCDDATLSVRHGRLYLEFGREARSLLDAVVSAVQDVRRASIGTQVLQVDECSLVTLAEIARRMERSRQLVHQYMTGQRGPGGFPSPMCQMGDGHAPLWLWSEVSSWLVEHDLLRKDARERAEVLSAINEVLTAQQQSREYRKLVKSVSAKIPA